MSYYRDTYLKSEDWKNLRALKLHESKNKCKLCGKKNQSNDVHHVKYKKLYDVKLSDLIVLCRPCHNNVHVLLEKYAGLKKLDTKLNIKTVKLHITKPLRQAIAGRKFSRRRRGKIHETFCIFKRELFANGLICKKRMVWRDSFFESEIIEQSLTSPDALIRGYMEVTMRDPRRLIPVLYKPFKMP